MGKADDIEKFVTSAHMTYQAGRNFLGIGLSKLFFIICLVVYGFVLALHPYSMKLWRFGNANDTNRFYGGAIGLSLLVLIASTYLDWPWKLSKC
tara:strand:- start:225 stop:506 length:282 start_codon:yes stop_codon:yes gene_type:complete